MKRFLTLLCTLLLTAAILCSCTLPVLPETSEPETEPTVETAPPLPNLGTDLTLYPIYEHLSEDDKIIWENIATAIKNHSTEHVHLGSYGTVYEYENAKKRFDQMYRELVYAHPDYFWVNLYDYTLHTGEEGNIRHLELELHYLMDEATAQSNNEAYTAKVNELVTAAKQQPDLFHQVLYVYDTIMANAKYDHELADNMDIERVDLSSYGCLVMGNTVCSGYALAFRSIMEKIGVECGVEFNSYQFLSGYPGHVWNYCNLDGEYYYFDLTWDDTGFDDDQMRDILPYSHLFFGISKADMELASYFLNDYSPVPQCNGTAYNYFRQKGLSFETYDYQTVKAAIREHKDEDVITLRFDTPAETQKAKADLIDKGRIFNILSSIDGVEYLTPETDLHLILILD